MIMKVFTFGWIASPTLHTINTRLGVMLMSR
jgi:hypothetical protein